MRKFLALVALATVLASPAFAQSYDPDLGTGNIAPVPSGQTAWTNGAAGAFARVPGTDQWFAPVQPQVQHLRGNHRR